MAPTSRLLRAAVSRRNSPTSFLHSHPSNLPPFFSTSNTRSVHTRATTLQNSRSIPHPSNLRIPNPHFFSTSTSRSVQTRAATFQNPRSIWLYGIAFGFIATGFIAIKKFKEYCGQGIKGTINSDMECKVRGVLPGLFREGHSVVVEGFGKPVEDETWEYYLSLTEVLAQPQKIQAALDKNLNIITNKLKVAEEEKLKVAEEQKAAVDGDTISSEAITKSATHPLKTKPKGKVYETALPPRLEVELTMMLKMLLVRFQGLSEVLREGDSVFIKVIGKNNTDEIKEDQYQSDEILEDQSDEILEDKLADFNEYNLAKSMTTKVGKKEYHISVEVLNEHDEKFMPQEIAAVIIAE